MTRTLQRIDNPALIFCVVLGLLISASALPRLASVATWAAPQPIILIATATPQPLVRVALMPSGRGTMHERKATPAPTAEPVIVEAEVPAPIVIVAPTAVPTAAPPAALSVDAAPAKPLKGGLFDKDKTTGETRVIATPEAQP